MTSHGDGDHSSLILARGNCCLVKQKTGQVSAIGLLKREPERNVISTGNKPRASAFMLDRKLLHVRRKSCEASSCMAEGK